MTMKRFIAMCLSALMIISCVSVVASAAAADWTPGNGSHIVVGGEVLEENTPVTVTDGADGVVVTHGGYYQDGKNWSGVASNEKYNINGLEVTVRFDTIPEVTAADDCWICFDLLSKPSMFDVTDVPGNPGFMSLIRFGLGFIQVFDGVESFNMVYDSQIDNPGFFTISSGDVITAKWEYIVDPTPAYEVTFTKNGKDSFTLPYTQENLVDCFADGKAHVVLNCNLIESQKDAFKYTILSVTDGVEKTQEEIDAVATIRAEAEIAENIKKGGQEIELAEEAVNKAIAEAEEANVAEATAKVEEAVAALDAAKAALEAGSFEEIEDLCDTAKDAANDARKMIRDAKEDAGETSETADGESDAENNENSGEKDGIDPIVAIAIIAAIVIVAAVVVIVLKKKKN